MNRTTRTVVEVFGIIVAFVVLGVIAYYIGSSLAKSFLTANGMRLTEWENKYADLDETLIFCSCVITLLWYASARFWMKITGPYSVGARAVWVFFWIINILASLLLPFIYTLLDSRFKLGMSIYFLSLLFFGVAGYYGCSLLATPACYKYTPLGAQAVRAVKYKRRSAK